MNRLWMSSMVMAACVLTGEAMYAAPLAVHVPVHATFGSEKPVKVSLHNGTEKTVKLMVGAQEMTLRPSGTITVRLMAGTKIVEEAGLPKVTPGTVLTIVSAEMSNGTITIR